MKCTLFVFAVTITLTFISCTNEYPSEANTLRFSTASDSTIHYYRSGWTQIMDYGQYTEAENSYRMALSFDPGFVTGKSVLARLSTDQEERRQLLSEIHKQKETVGGTERLLLDVYTALTEYTIARDDGSTRTTALLDSTLALAEENLREVVHTYPNEIYIKAEYIEVLNYRHGPQAALDSLNALTHETENMNPFLLGYAAGMNATLGNFDTALEKARQLEHLLADPGYPKSHAVFADIYLKMNDLATACPYAEKAYSLDPNNVDVQRLLAQCE